MPDPARRYFMRVRREHNLTRDRVDALPWPHPRPLRDERLQALHIAFIWTSIVQIIFGPPPQTMQATTFGYLATVFFSALMIICSCLVLYAAHCKSQYNSFGFEMAGTAGFAGVFLIYSVGLIFGVTNWWGTNTMALAVALFVGNLMRCIKLVRRLW
jgi:hypothetical protein